MARSYEIYQGECRFTERSLEVKTHGSGIKLSIRHSPAKGDVVSIFLDAGDLSDLANALNDVSGDQDRLEDRATQLTRVLSELANTLHRNGF